MLILDAVNVEQPMEVQGEGVVCVVKGVFMRDHCVELWMLILSRHRDGFTHEQGLLANAAASCMPTVDRQPADSKLDLH